MISVRRSMCLAFLAVGLAGCQSGAGVTKDVHTGETTATGLNVSAYSGLFDFMRAQPFHSSKAGYGIRTLYSNYGWIYIDEAWSHGKRLPYSKGVSNVLACGGAGGCVTQETGVISMTESEFRAAAQSGFEFELVGRAGKVVGKIPAKAFQAAL